MEISFLLFKQIAQFFIMIIMGYTLVKLKIVKSEDSKVLSMVCLYLIMPCVIINSFLKSKDLVALLQKNGFEVKSTQSSIEDDAIGFLLKYWERF